MLVKDGVTLSGIDIKVRPILQVAEQLWKEYGQELVITEAMGGTHSAGSLHYYGLALDLRSRYFTEQQKDEIVEKLKSRLGVCFDVIHHSTHIHVEYQP